MTFLPLLTKAQVLRLFIIALLALSPSAETSLAYLSERKSLFHFIKEARAAVAPRPKPKSITRPLYLKGSLLLPRYLLIKCPATPAPETATPPDTGKPICIYLLLNAALRASRESEDPPEPEVAEAGEVAGELPAELSLRVTIACLTTGATA